MKASELMIGDWVIRRGVPEEPVRLYDMNVLANIAYLDQDGRGVTEKFKNIEPIPLTEEILEKNGFKKKVWREYRETDIITYAIGGGFFIEVTVGEYWLVDNCSDSNDGYYTSNWIVKVEYIHKLQHLMRDLEIEKEIVL